MDVLPVTQPTTRALTENQSLRCLNLKTLLCFISEKCIAITKDPIFSILKHLNKYISVFYLQLIYATNTIDNLALCANVANRLSVVPYLSCAPGPGMKVGALVSRRRWLVDRRMHSHSGSNSSCGVCCCEPSRGHTSRTCDEHIQPHLWSKQAYNYRNKRKLIFV